MRIKNLATSIIKQTVFLMFILLFLIPVKSVMAHATLVKSDPPRRASLSEPPKSVQLWFNEEIEQNYASITIRDSDKNLIKHDKPESVPDDLTSVVLEIPEIAPGKYTVEFSVLSVDGHVVESSYGFSVKDLTQ